jgi:hypothetical protein
MRRAELAPIFLLAASLPSATAFGEVVHLKNGDVLHGTLVAANNDEVTLKTPFGQLVIPKKEIERIEYQDPGARPAPAPSPPPKPAMPAIEDPNPPGRSDLKPARAVTAIELRIRGRSFWYAFDSPERAPSDTSIRLRLYVGNERACTFIDEKPDTVDGTTLYNSFTFSSTDARLVESREGYDCSVEKASGGVVVLRIGLPAVKAGRPMVRMLYEVNEGTRSSPAWMDVVSRSFSMDVAPGKVGVATLEQNADALEYTGLFKKKMKNVELFQLEVIATELKD